MDRGLLDTRRRDFDARDRRKTGFGELGIARREGIGRIHHFPPHRLRHHVEAEFASLAHVLERMLLGAIGIARDCQRDHRRNEADHGEKRKRREITDAALAYGRCPADRPRNHSAGEESINLTLFGDCGIELEIIGNHGHEPSDDAMRDAICQLLGCSAADYSSTRKRRDTAGAGQATALHRWRERIVVAPVGATGRLRAVQL